MEKREISKKPRNLIILGYLNKILYLLWYQKKSEQLLMYKV